MTHQELRSRFISFFEARGHAVVPSSSLLPSDPSVLFTTAGMQQFKPYFMGEADPIKDFGGRRTVSIQKAMRTSDIDEVGDESHLTFFEMLGHFSFGDYFKKETIEWTFEFLTKELGISTNRVSATVFAGDDIIPFDEESYNAWSKLIPPGSIKKGPRKDNVWGPAGPEGPCGAANEVYVDGLEVATLVFMEYFSAKDGGLVPLPQKGVDVGWGLERLTLVVQDVTTVFETDLFEPVMRHLPSDLNIRSKRIITDHSRAIAFLIADGVVPSNKEQGYVLRRLMRRVITHSYLYNRGQKREHDAFDIRQIPILFVDLFSKIYPNFDRHRVEEVFNIELAKFTVTINAGMREFEHIVDTYVGWQGEQLKLSERTLPGSVAFRLFESFGFPLEVTREIAKEEYNAVVDEVGFRRAQEEHQKKSRAGAAKKFGGHGLLLDTGELKAADEEELQKVTRLHTATHLLHAALRKVLGAEVGQAGSDITAARLRFDFTFPRKLTDEEKAQIQDLVNEVIAKDLPVQMVRMPIEQAKDTGALYFFKEKYPDEVNVYYVGHNLESAFSKEFCGGPHVERTGTIGTFRILKEEAVGAGARRIRANVE